MRSSTAKLVVAGIGFELQGATFHDEIGSGGDVRVTVFIEDQRAGSRFGQGEPVEVEGVVESGNIRRDRHARDGENTRQQEDGET